MHQFFFFSNMLKWRPRVKYNKEICKWLIRFLTFDSKYIYLYFEQDKNFTKLNLIKRKIDEN